MREHEPTVGPRASGATSFVAGQTVRPSGEGKARTQSRLTRKLNFAALRAAWTMARPIICRGGSQYVGIVGSTCRAQPRMPPSRLYRRERPCAARAWHAAADRTPDLQCTRMSRPSAGSCAATLSTLRCGCCRSTKGSETICASACVKVRVRVRVRVSVRGRVRVRVRVRLLTISQWGIRISSSLRADD